MRKLEVRLTRQPGQERIVGRLAEARARPASRQVYFEYDPVFLRDPLWLSPFKLPPQPGLIEHRDHAFGPLFGLFDDSLPDGWGLLLMDRFFQQRGSALAEVSVLDRLAYLGTRTMGALTYHPPDDPGDHQEQMLDLHEMARASQQVIEGSAGEVLPQLLRAGGSPGGARPDHVKNFAFRLTDEGNWELSPAYDLVYAPGPGGEHTMTVAGEGRAPARSHLLQLAGLARISSQDAQSIFDDVASAAARWRDHARQAGVGSKTARVVGNAIKECLARL